MSLRDRLEDIKNDYAGKFKDPWYYDAKELITLCKICHEAGHRNYKIPVFIVNN